MADEEVPARLQVLVAHGWAYRRLLRLGVMALWVIATVEVGRFLVELAGLWRAP